MQGTIPGTEQAILQQFLPVTLTPGPGVTILSQDCYLYGKLLFVYVRWENALTLDPYSTIATHGFNSRIAWNSQLMDDGNMVVTNNGIYADKYNTTIRSANSIPVSTYRTSLIIPVL